MIMSNTRIPGVIGIHDHTALVCRRSTPFDFYRPRQEVTFIDFFSRGPVGITLPIEPSSNPSKPTFQKGMFDDEAVKKYGKATDHANYKKGTDIYLLQKKLLDFGIKEVGALDGDFGKKTENAVKTFQSLAKTKNRNVLVNSKEKTKEVEITFAGEVNGVVDASTWSEINVWKRNKYLVPILTLEGTNFQYQFTRLTLQECLNTLPAQLRPNFKKDISTVITKMHGIGFSFGSWPNAKAGYRTFQQQYDIDPSKTNAGPGESFHNYGLAVDLGSINWVDKNGESHDYDFWLGKMKPSSFASAVWKKRNEFAPSNLHTLSFEIIHFQGVPANTSGRASLIKCLNTVTGESVDHKKWKYTTGSGNTYKCTLGTESNWTNIGTAKQMWNKSAANCTNEQRENIKSHMASAEAKALTISLA